MVSRRRSSLSNKERDVAGKKHSSAVKADKISCAIVRINTKTYPFEYSVRCITPGYRKTFISVPITWVRAKTSTDGQTGDDKPNIPVFEKKPYNDIENRPSFDYVLQYGRMFSNLPSVRGKVRGD